VNGFGIVFACCTEDDASHAVRGPPVRSVVVSGAVAGLQHWRPAGMPVSCSGRLSSRASGWTRMTYCERQAR
jgi:hypothetical protein